METQAYGQPSVVGGEGTRTLDGEPKEKDEITLNVLHENITASLRPLSTKGIASHLSDGP